jgi:hypothetical protein
MAEQLHSLLTAIHRPYADVYADATERLAATGFTRVLGSGTSGGTVPFTVDDLYKKVLQIDDASEWILTAITPTWVQVSGAGALTNDSVTNALLANMAQATIKGRASGAGTGDPTDLSAAQVKTILALASGDISGFDAAVDARIKLLQKWALNFTADGDAYIPAYEAMTIDAGVTAIGTGTLSYEKSTAAAPGTFVSTSLPATLEAGAWLKVSVASLAGFKAVELKRTA